MAIYNPAKYHIEFNAKDLKRDKEAKMETKSQAAREKKSARVDIIGQNTEGLAIRLLHMIQDDQADYPVPLVTTTQQYADRSITHKWAAEAIAEEIIINFESTESANLGLGYNRTFFQVHGVTRPTHISGRYL